MGSTGGLLLGRRTYEDFHAYWPARTDNPFSKILIDKMPTPQHKLLVDMEGKLQVLGYDLTDQTGKLVDSIGPGR